MSYEQRDNSGALFQNKKKREGRKDPEYTGSGMVNGQEVWISLWKKTDKNGNPWLSVSFQEKLKSNNRPAPEKGAEYQSYGGVYDDDVPFAKVPDATTI